MVSAKLMFSNKVKAAKASEVGRVALNQNEQVSMGQELLQMLREQPSSASLDSASTADFCYNSDDVEVKVILKNSFIEVVDPRSTRRMNRSMSDSALLDSNFAAYSEQEVFPGQISAEKEKLQDWSDASTTISNDVEDLNTPTGGWNTVRKDTCWSDEEGEYTMEQCMPYGYCDWWMMPMGFDPSAMGMDAATFEQYQAQWGEQCEIQCDNAEDDGSEWRTTVMLRNMPNNYTRDMLLELVDSMGFSSCYDFAYLPVDFKSQAGLGYAFINFVSTAEAQRCFEFFEGFSEWKVPSEKVCTVTWGSPYQGLEAHIERYQNSPVMHHSIPDEWKPVLLKSGARIVFPAPTKAIKTPKVRQQAESGSGAIKMQ